MVIVGAGPSGLMLGCELLRWGVQCTVLERRAEVDPRARAVMLHAASLELLEQLGLRNQLEARGVRQERIAFVAGERARYVARFDGLETPYPYFVNVTQPQVEQALAAAFVERGGHLCRSHQYVSHVDGQHDVVVTVDAPDGQQRLQATYLVGADGASSAVRESLGVAFEGTSYPMAYLLAEGRLKRDLDRSESAMYIGPEGAASVLPLPSGRWRVAGPVSRTIASDGTSPAGGAITTAEFVAAIDRLGFGADLQLELFEELGTYRVHERLARRFCTARTALIGDAGHVNSPAGGQAMNTGFGDAQNLAWRLADSLHGNQTNALESYAAERRLVAGGVRQATSVLPLLREMFDADTLDDSIQQQVDQLPQAWSQLYFDYSARPEGPDTAPQSSEAHTNQPAILRTGQRVPWLGTLPDLGIVAGAPSPATYLCRTDSDVSPAVASRRIDVPSDHPLSARLPSGGLLVRPDGYVEAAADARAIDFASGSISRRSVS